MATTNQNTNIGGLARRLIRDGLLTNEVAEESYAKAQKSKQAFVPYLVENKLLDSLSIAKAGSQEFGVPLLNLSAMDMETEYNNRARVPEHPAIIDAWQRNAATYRAAAAGGPGSAELDLCYGDDERQSRTLAASWAGAGASARFATIAHCSHFTVLDGLTEADSDLTRTLVTLGSPAP